jgi:hypothetical protein
MKFNGRGSLAAHTRNNSNTSMRCDDDNCENESVMCEPNAVTMSGFLDFLDKACVWTAGGVALTGRGGKLTDTIC